MRADKFKIAFAMINLTIYWLLVRFANFDPSNNRKLRGKIENNNGFVATTKIIDIWPFSCNEIFCYEQQQDYWISAENW